MPGKRAGRWDVCQRRAGVSLSMGSCGPRARCCGHPWASQGKIWFPRCGLSIFCPPPRPWPGRAVFPHRNTCPPLARAGRGGFGDAGPGCATRELCLHPDPGRAGVAARCAGTRLWRPVERRWLVLGPLPKVTLWRSTGVFFAAGRWTRIRSVLPLFHMWAGHPTHMIFAKISKARLHKKSFRIFCGLSGIAMIPYFHG